MPTASKSAKSTTTKSVKPKTAKVVKVKAKAKEEAPVQAKRVGKYQYANGKRKTAIARVRLYEKGKGEIIVNGKPVEEVFTIAIHREVINSPLKLTGHGTTFDISVIVVGGGKNSQADAIRHGIAKSLVEFDPELRPTLKRAGMLTRDARVKERKKFGLKKARRAPQWAKR